MSFRRNSHPFIPELHEKIKEKHENNFKKEEIRTVKLNNKAEFRYGNYHRYYGYRNIGDTDPRLVCMKKEWFEGKDILDIGCNAGHFTLSIAKQYSARTVIGIDIDPVLVKIAMSNIRHYITPKDLSEDDFPVSLVLNYGPIAQILDPKGRCRTSKFPFNVQFLECNYILPNDEMLNWQEPCFDTIICLSLTKWVHLNWGDIGIQRLFRRMHAQLKPGGHMILEAQTFGSYARRKKIAPDVFKNYLKIQLFPEMFNEYLLNEVGFESCEFIDTPAHSTKGFNRPLYLFTKKKNEFPVKATRHVIYDDSSDSHCEYSDVEELSDTD